MAEPADPVTRRPSIIERWEPAFADALAHALETEDGTVAWAGGRDPRRFFDGLDGRCRLIPAAALDAPDAIASLRAAGVGLVLTDRTLLRVAPWVEPQRNTLPVRLRDGLEAPGFTAIALSSGWALHKLTEATAVPDGAQMLTRARSTLFGDPPPPLSGPPCAPQGGPVTLTLYGASGRRLATCTAEDVDAAATALRQATDVPHDGRLGLSLHHAPCELCDRSTASLPWWVQAGRHGLRVNNATLDPAWALENGIQNPVVLVESMVKQAGLDTFLRPARHPAVVQTRPMVLAETAWAAASRPALWRFTADTWMETPDGTAVRLYRGVPLRRVEDVTPAAVRHAVDLAARRLVADQREDGSFAQLYRQGMGPAIGGAGQMDRHAPIPLALLMAHRWVPDPALVESARKGIAYTLAHQDKLEAGEAALAVLALLHLADHQPLGPWDATLADLARSLQQAAPPLPQAAIGLLALSRLYVRSGDAALLAHVTQGMDAAWDGWQERLDQRGDDGTFPDDTRIAMTGFAPWMASAANALHAITGDPTHAARALALQDWIATTLLYTPATMPDEDALGGLFKRHDEPPSITAYRGLQTAAAALAVARRTTTDPEPHAVVWGVRFCLQLQYDGPGTTWFLPDAEHALGAFRYSLGHAHTRSDWTARTIIALTAAGTALWPEAAP